MDWDMDGLCFCSAWLFNRIRQYAVGDRFQQLGVVKSLGVVA